LQTKNDRIFDKATGTLSGSTGIAYLLFVGRDNYASNIQRPMKAVFAHESNVNQTVARLTQAGKQFLISKGHYRKKGTPGRARDIYTANINPIIGTLKKFDITYDESELIFVLSALSESSDHFPKFLSNMFQPFLIRKFHWHQLLAFYFLLV